MTLVQTGLAIRHRARVAMPPKIVQKMQDVLSLLPDPGLEYGAYLKGTWDPIKAEVAIDPNAFYFPKQVTSSVTIQFTEEPPGPEWNVVIHRHPPNCRSFSGTDRQSINEEFLASVLFLPPRDFPDAIVNIPLGRGSKMQVPADVVVVRDPSSVDAQLARTVAENLTQMSRRDFSELSGGLQAQDRMDLETVLGIGAKRGSVHNPIKVTAKGSALNGARGSAVEITEPGGLPRGGIRRLVRKPEAQPQGELAFSSVKASAPDTTAGSTAETVGRARARAQNTR